MSDGYLYRLYDADDELLYIGMTRSTVDSRIRDHRAKRWGDEIARVDVSLVAVTDLAEAESMAIKAEHPRHNQQYASGAPSTQDRKRRREHRTLNARVAALEQATTPRAAYSPAEAAEYLGVTRQTVHALINRGELRRFKVGRSTRIPTADVHALVGSSNA